MKRPELASKKLPEFLDPRVIENAALKSRVAELETQINDLQGKYDDTLRDMTLARRERDYWHDIVRIQREARDLGQRAAQIDYSALQGFQQNNQALAQQAQAQRLPEAQYLGGLGQVVSPFQQLQHWGDCTCVPGRAAAFGVLREDNQ